MKNKELYEKTISILVKAYQNDTLEHGSCMACAVGNIVAANCGINEVFDQYEWDSKAIAKGADGWAEVFYTGMAQRIQEGQYTLNAAAKFQIDSTGYTWQELAKVEYAFETAPQGESEDDWMFNGLMAVVDVLNEIHEVEEKSASKNLFIKSPAVC